MVILAVELQKLRVKVNADLPTRALHHRQRALGEHSASILRHKDQMNIKLKNNMSSSTDIRHCFSTDQMILS